tara:strand:+ start:616 stop:879 length:264 start_codon:yes stop_codon:yes gene_type:complete
MSEDIVKILRSNEELGAKCAELEQENKRLRNARIRHIPIRGKNIAEIRENAYCSELYHNGGDMRLVWVNEGDLINHDFVHDTLKGGK